MTFWMLMSLLNFIFYSCNFIASLLTSLMSIGALLFALSATDTNLWIVLIVTIIWLVITLSVLECLHNHFAGWVFESVRTNKGAELLIKNLHEGVVVLDDEEKVVLFANQAAEKKLKVKEGSSLKVQFDASNLDR